MAIAAIYAASTGATDATGAFTFTGSNPGGAAIGDLVILQIGIDGTGAISWGTISATNIEALDGTANTWTLIGTFNVGSPTLAQQRLYVGRRTSASSAPTFTTTANTSGDDVYGRMYYFKNVNTGTTLASIIENATAGATVSGAGTSGTIADASVTTLGPDRLALNFIAISDDNAIPTFTGMTGGIWQTHPSITAYVEAGGTDMSISVQMAIPGLLSAMPSPQTVTTSLQGTGGNPDGLAQSFSLGSDQTIRYVSFWAVPTGSPTGNLIVEVRTDNAGVPSSTVLGSGQMAAADLPAVASAMAISIPITATALTGSTTYWIVWRRDVAADGAAIQVDRAPASSLYAGGVPATLNAGTWTPGTTDFGFTLQDGSGAVIDGGTATNSDATDGWGVVGFALIGTTVFDTTPVPRHPGIDHMNPGLL